MQEKIQIFSPIKKNILHFVDYLNISKREFYSKTGISRGTLESQTGITEDTLAKFIATYPEVNIEWLITGSGEMIKTENILIEVKQVDNEWLLRRIEELAIENAFIKKENEELKRSRGTPVNTTTYSFTEKIGTQIAAEPK